MRISVPKDSMLLFGCNFPSPLRYATFLSSWYLPWPGHRRPSHGFTIVGFGLNQETITDPIKTNTLSKACTRRDHYLPSIQALSQCTLARSLRIVKKEASTQKENTTHVFSLPTLGAFVPRSWLSKKKSVRNLESFETRFWASCVRLV